jgi:hypothetical protein
MDMKNTSPHTILAPKTAYAPRVSWEKFLIPMQDRTPVEYSLQHDAIIHGK